MSKVDQFLAIMSDGKAHSTGSFCDVRILRSGSIVHRLQERGYKIENVTTDRTMAWYVWHMDCPRRQGVLV